MGFWCFGGFWGFGIGEWPQIPQERLRRDLGVLDQGTRDGIRENSPRLFRKDSIKILGIWDQ